MKRYVLMLMGLFILIYILPLGVRPLFSPDEVRYAEIPREMIESGDWVVPRLDGLHYFEKPVLGYWLNAVSMKIFGENAFAVRLPSALSVGMSALLLFGLVRRFQAGYLQGALTAAVFLTFPMVFGVGTYCVLDSALSFFLTGAMITFFYGYMEDSPAKKKAWMVVFGAFCGLAFLTKGFLAFAVPVISIAPFVVWERRLKELMRICWLPILAAILVCLPWAVMIHQKEPDFWHYFFWTEHIRRFMSNDAQHHKPFWYFVPMLLTGAFQWIILSPAVISGLRKIRKRDPLIRFALCWLILPFLFFSSSSGKLGTYILPCFAPLAVLISKGLLQYLEGNERRKFSFGAFYFAGLFAVCAVALITVQTVGWGGFQPYGENETWKWVTAALCLSACGIFAAFAARSSNLNKMLFWYCSCPLFLMLCGPFIIPQTTLSEKAPGELLVRNAHRVKPDSIIIADEAAKAVCWFYRRSDVFLFSSPGELRYGLTYNDASDRFLRTADLSALVTSADKGRVVIIFEATSARQFRFFLPKPAYEDTDGKLVFAAY